VPTNCIVPSHGECFCPAHTTDEYIRSREGQQYGDAAFSKLLWTLINSGYKSKRNRCTYSDNGDV